MRPEEMGSLPLQVEKLFYGLQDRIMSDVVRRIKKTGEITSTADYQLNRIKILGNSTEFIEDELKRLLNATYPEIFALYDKVIDWEYVRNKSLYEQWAVHTARRKQLAAGIVLCNRQSDKRGDQKYHTIPGFLPGLR